MAKPFPNVSISMGSDELGLKYGIAIMNDDDDAEDEEV